MEFDILYKKYKHLKYQIKSLILKQQELVELNGFPKKDLIGGSRPTGINRPGENLITAISELQERQYELELEFLSVRKKLETLISKIDISGISDASKIKYVCESRLFNNNCWKDIARSVDRSYSRAREYFHIGLSLIRTYPLQ